MSDARRLLLIDDEVDLLDILTDAFEIAGFTVVTANDGRSAMSCLQEGTRFDVVISDMAMPGGISGIDVAREATVLHPGACVILASGHPRAELPGSPGEA